MAGIAHHVVRESTGSGEPASAVTLIHGVGDSLAAWDEVIAELPDGLDVIRYDLRGHGASEKPPGPTRWRTSSPTISTCSPNRASDEPTSSVSRSGE